jgi:hypothetical protein
MTEQKNFQQELTGFARKLSDKRYSQIVPNHAQRLWPLVLAAQPEEFALHISMQRTIGFGMKTTLEEKSGSEPVHFVGVISAATGTQNLNECIVVGFEATSAQFSSLLRGEAVSTLVVRHMKPQTFLDGIKLKEAVEVLRKAEIWTTPKKPNPDQTNFNGPDKPDIS